MTPRLLLASSILACTCAGYAQTPAESVAPASAVSSSASLQPSSAVAPSAVEPEEPLADSPDIMVDPASLLPQLPGLSSRKVSLIGGTVEKLDRVRDQLTLRICGGGKMKIDFDPRTHVYRDGLEAPISDLHRGDRVSIDTVLDNGVVVARNIRLETAAAGESQGMVVSYSDSNGELILRDPLSPRPLKLRVTSQTRLVDRGRPAAASGREIQLTERWRRCRPGSFRSCHSWIHGYVRRPCHSSGSPRQSSRRNLGSRRQELRHLSRYLRDNLE